MFGQRRRTGVVVITVSASISLMGGATAATAAATPQAPRNADVEFSIFDNGAHLQRGEEFKLKELAQYGVPQRAVDDLAEGKSPAGGARAKSARAVNPYDIAAEWNEKDGWLTVIRNGRWDGLDAGFGLAKVEGKHNLTIAAVRATTKYPRPGPAGKVHEAGQKYHYRTEVFHVKCSGWWIFRTCRIDEVKTVRVGVDFRLLRDGKPFGVVTAFCENTPGRCPDWVKNALNI